jgi:hypothetical protein
VQSPHSPPPAPRPRAPPSPAPEPGAQKRRMCVRTDYRGWLDGLLRDALVQRRSTRSAGRARGGRGACVEWTWRRVCVRVLGCRSFRCSWERSNSSRARVCMCVRRISLGFEIGILGSRCPGRSLGFRRRAMGFFGRTSLTSPRLLGNKGGASVDAV